MLTTMPSIPIRATLRPPVHTLGPGGAGSGGRAGPLAPRNRKQDGSFKGSGSKRTGRCKADVGRPISDGGRGVPPEDGGVLSSMTRLGAQFC